MKNTIVPEKNIEQHLKYLRLPFIAEEYESTAQLAAHKQWSHQAYLAELVTGEAAMRRDRATKRRIKAARFPVLKTLEQFNWNWPKEINQAQVRNLFHADFITEKSNIIFLGGVGMGKTHLASALGYAACLNGNTVLFTTAVETINSLSAAQSTGRLKQELGKYTKPALLILDELGYLPIDKLGADLLFQVISLRYETGSLIITSNRAFKDWAEIFNNDSTLTSAILDRLLHHAETVLISGTSYRMKDRVA